MRRLLWMPLVSLALGCTPSVNDEQSSIGDALGYVDSGASKPRAFSLTEAAPELVYKYTCSLEPSCLVWLSAQFTTPNLVTRSREQGDGAVLAIRWGYKVFNGSTVLERDALDASDVTLGWVDDVGFVSDAPGEIVPPGSTYFSLKRSQSLSTESFPTLDGTFTLASSPISCGDSPCTDGIVKSR